MQNDGPNKKVAGDLKNGLKQVRARLGLNQHELAQRAGIARQTIGSIEAGLFAPSAIVALRLARALGCRVEELFWLEDVETERILATRAELPAGEAASGTQERLLIADVEGGWVAHPLRGEAAFRTEMIPADGLSLSDIREEELEIQLLDSQESLAQTVLIAGCSPAISLWTRSAERWQPGLRPSWIHANSTMALQALSRREVHIAGLHLCDPETGADNVPFAYMTLRGLPTTLINFGVWDEGLLLAKGNPRGIRELSDLTQPNVRFINREWGAGSRLLFDSLLHQQKVPTKEVKGYSRTANSHQAIARLVRDGRADAGMGTAAMAQIYGLDFLPLRQVRFDFAVRSYVLDEEPVRQLFETLAHPTVRLQLQKLGGYDTTHTGEVMARLD